MTDLTPEQRARALELYRLYHYLRSGNESEVTGVSDMLPKTVRAWLAVEAHILATVCPDSTDPTTLRKGEKVCPDCWLIHPKGACDR